LVVVEDPSGPVEPTHYQEMEDRIPRNGRLLTVFTPDGQKPSEIIGLPIGMYFLTVNRQELADKTPSSRKTSLS